MTRDGLGTGLAPAANPADRQRLMTAAAIAIDKAQLLTGEATERLEDTGGLDLEADLRAWQAREDELTRLRQLVRDTGNPSPHPEALTSPGLRTPGAK